MKTAWFSAALLILSCAALRGEPASIQFDGGTYLLAKVTTAPDGSVINDYVKQGESIENWTTLLSVQQLSKAPTMNDAINGWLQSVRGRLAKKWNATRTPNATRDADVLIEAWLLNAQDPQVNATLQRFVTEDGIDGVKVYRFVQKLDPDAPEAKETFSAKKFVRSESLGNLKLSLVNPKVEGVAAK